MDNACQEITLPDLIVNACPLGCNQECSKTWTNKTIRHRIVCKCKCDHNKKQVALDSVEPPLSNAKGNDCHFRSEIQND